jgi:hypothetical protein
MFQETDQASDAHPADTLTARLLRPFWVEISSEGSSGHIDFCLGSPTNQDGMSFRYCLHRNLLTATKSPDPLLVSSHPFTLYPCLIPLPHPSFTLSHLFSSFSPPPLCSGVLKPMCPVWSSKGSSRKWGETES